MPKVPFYLFGYYFNLYLFIIIVTLFIIYYEIPWKGGIEANPAPNITLL